MKYDYEKYKDIIDLPHHVSKKHPHMSLEMRAAQFAPYAALVGYSDEVKEIERSTDEKIEIDEELQALVNKKLFELSFKVGNKPKVKITYFVPDSKKEGGKYITIIDNLKKINEYESVIILKNDKKIPMADILEISEEN